MLRAHRAQVSVEFLSMVGVVLAIFLGLFAIAAAQNTSASDTHLRFALQRTCNDFSTAVNLALSCGSGFTTHITLPEKIKGFNYSVTTTARTVVFQSGKRTVFCRLISDKVSYVEIEKGKLDLRNENGTVYIEEA